MKKALLLLLITIVTTINLSALRNWRLYTNMTHVYDMIEIDDQFYLATWGGLVIYDRQTDDFVKSYTTLDGLQDMDIRSISYMSSNETLLLGTFKAGVNRLRNGRFITPINEEIGLRTNKINSVVSSDSLIYIGTDQGLTVLKDVETFPFPFVVDHYDIYNGLAANQVNDLVLTPDGHLLIATNNGFSYVHASEMNDLEAWQSFNSANSPMLDNRINAVSAMGSSFAIGTRYGLVRIDDLADHSSWSVFTAENSPLVSNEILTAFIDSSYNIWFTYGVWNDGLLNIDDSTTVPTAITRISPDNQFKSWIRDAWTQDVTGLTTSKFRGFLEIKGSIYAYSWDDGFYSYDDQNDYWHNRQPNSIIASNITDVSVDKGGKIWTVNGYIGSGVNRKGTRGVSGFDGTVWTNYNARYSHLHQSNRIFRVETDTRNRKWFGSWGYGVSVFDEPQDRWYNLTSDNGLEIDDIGEIMSDRDGNVWVSNYTGGIFVLDIDAIETYSDNMGSDIPVIRIFDILEPRPTIGNIPVSDVIKMHQTSDKTFFGCRYSGIRYWDDVSLPQSPTPGDHWRKPPVAINTYIYDIDSKETYFGEEVWIAAESGLLMFETNTGNWYRYGTSIKREIWQGNQWQINRRYFENEERLYGAAPTFPTAVLVDPFDRIWIGSETNGLTLYNLTTDRYTIYNMENSPLVSNSITSLDYEPETGNLWIGTNEGLHSVEIGSIYKTDAPELSSTVVYPNPFKPDKGHILTIANKNDTIMPVGKNRCRIFNVSGELIVTLEEDQFFRFSWDGRNSDGRKCSSGIYYYVVTSETGKSSRGTIVLIR